MLRKHVDRNVLIYFGLVSAVGGRTGALLHSFAGNSILSGVFGVLLLFVGVMELTGKAQTMRFGRRTAWVAGLLSGLLGGLVGNQGGIRSAALVGFHLNRQAFVTTGTAVGLIIDGVRVPAYLMSEFDSLMSIWLMILLMSVGALIGTVVGERILHRIPEHWFRRSVAVVLLALGAFMLYQTFRTGIEA